MAESSVPSPLVDADRFVLRLEARQENDPIVVIQNWADDLSRPMSDEGSMRLMPNADAAIRLLANGRAGRHSATIQVGGETFVLSYTKPINTEDGRAVLLQFRDQSVLRHDLNRRPPGSDNQREGPVDYAVQRLAHTVAEADLGEIAADLEPLMRDAELYIEDESNPPEVRDAVEKRLRTLRGELQMFGEGIAPDSITITRTAAFLMATCATTIRVGDDPDGENPKEVAQHLAAAAAELSTDQTAADGAQVLVDELETASQAFQQGWHGWLKKGFWENVNTALKAGMVGAGVIGTNIATGGALSAYLRAARALLRTRFPGIFP